MSREWVITVGIAIMLVLGGCSGVTTSDANTPVPGTETATATPTATPTPTPLGGAADNPWGKQVVTVSVRSEERANVQMGGVVRDAIEYWNGPASQYAEYPVNFEYRHDAANPDIVVIPVESIDDCGTEHSELTLGCAPRLEPHDDAKGLEIIRVVPGLTYDSTLDVVKHEFGHVVGRIHGEEPMPVMKSRTNVSRPPVPDADERDYSFRKSNVTIYAGGLDDEGELGRVVRHLNDPANTPAPDNLTIKVAESRYDADIVVENGDCPNLNGGSCASYWGYDYDGRGEFDWYVNATITLDDLDDDVTAWHVAHWTSRLLYGEAFHPFGPHTSRSTRENWD